MSSSIGYHCITPKQQAIVGINDMLPCPPPPRASIQVVEMLFPAQELRDGRPGSSLRLPATTAAMPMIEEFYSTAIGTIQSS
jgi:hypothetical protein